MVRTTVIPSTEVKHGLSEMLMLWVRVWIRCFLTAWISAAGLRDDISAKMSRYTVNRVCFPLQQQSGNLCMSSQSPIRLSDESAGELLNQYWPSSYFFVGPKVFEVESEMNLYVSQPYGSCHWTHDLASPEPSPWRHIDKPRYLHGPRRLLSGGQPTYWNVNVIYTAY